MADLPAGISTASLDPTRQSWGLTAVQPGLVHCAPVSQNHGDAQQQLQAPGSRRWRIRLCNSQGDQTLP